MFSTSLFNQIYDEVFEAQYYRYLAIFDNIVLRCRDMCWFGHY